MASRQLLAISIVLVAAASAAAIEPIFPSTRCDDGRISTRLDMADSLPDDLIAYIAKGVPISAEYTIELWRDRAGWFDALVGRARSEIRIRFDTWEKEYTVVQRTADLVIENIIDEEAEAFELLASSGPVTFEAADSLGRYYLAGTVVIRTMSISSFREVESWLKGEADDIGKPNPEDIPGKAGEFLFDMALKISGLDNLSAATRTAVFTRDSLPPPDTAAGRQ